MPGMRREGRIRIVGDGISVVADINLVAEVNQGPLDAAKDEQRPKGGKVTPDGEYRPLSRGELEELAGEQLPERAAMSLLNANVAIPINAAVAANVLSDNATAVADAAQSGQIDQVN